MSGVRCIGSKCVLPITTHQREQGGDGDSWPCAIRMHFLCERECVCEHVRQHYGGPRSGASTWQASDLRRWTGVPPVLLVADLSAGIWRWTPGPPSGVANYMARGTLKDIPTCAEILLLLRDWLRADVPRGPKGNSLAGAHGGQRRPGGTLGDHLLDTYMAGVGDGRSGPAWPLTGLLGGWNRGRWGWIP